MAAPTYLCEPQEDVPVCPDTDSIEDLVRQFCQTGSSRIIVLDQQRQPIGQVRLSQLLPYLLAGGDREQAIAQLQPSVIEPLSWDAIHPSGEDLDQFQLARDLAARNADLLQVARLKDEFLACITHELRSPLTAILGLSTLLKDQALGPLNQRQQRYAQLIYRSGRQLIGLVNDILDLTRLETGQLQLNLSPVKIEAVCLQAFEQVQQFYRQENQERTESAAALHPTARQQPPDMQLEIEPELVMLMADEHRLCQMLVHLLSNAMKFTDRSGQIGLKVSRWEGWIAFMVWDTGIGIPPDKQHLIFQKFQQLEPPLTRQFEGAGLGLALTQRLAHLHGGDVMFMSQEHRGSQFTLLLPPEPPSRIEAAPETEPLADSPAPSSAAPSKRLVLAVDANVRMLEELTEHLGELGYRVAIAHSGLEALEKARTLQPCAILLNPWLPLLSGWDVLTLLKTDAQTSSIPIVMTVPASAQNQGRGSQADDFLRLPVVHQELALTLGQLVGSPPLSPLEATSTTHPLILCLSWPRPETDGLRSPVGHRQPSDLDGLAELHRWLQEHHYRVIEAYDLEQADLLARVWKPQVVVVMGPVEEPMAYLTQLSQHTSLAALPLVMLDARLTQPASQFPGLMAFPCQTTGDAWSWGDGSPSLLQAIRTAARFAAQPLVYAIDVACWTTSSACEPSDWLHALMQYLKAAGLRGTLGRSSQDLIQALDTEVVHLILLDWHTPQDELCQVLQTLGQVASLPPVLVVAHDDTGQGDAAAAAAMACNWSETIAKMPLQQLFWVTLSPGEGLDGVLRQIRQCLGLTA
jgi:signal transduction histidine kinase/DNA-binding response OmpR family regulator